MKIKLNPFLKAVRGKMGDTVFRLCHTGELQVISCPDMKKVKWSEAQKEHRRKFRDAVDYAKVCMRLPELHAYYLKMAHKRGTNRPFDEAVRDFFKGNCLNFDQASRQALADELNRSSSRAFAIPASEPAPESTPQMEHVAINTQNRPQRAGFASSSSTTTASRCAGGPATMDDRWIVASLVMSNSMSGENDFYGVSTMCFLETANAVGLPH